ncbi:MAG: alpha-L-arabinofuranosidase [Lachnospiraceae bacterium]|nr:alpha-L-arabinofuranosidase [Lachnospiraceae bacterium]MBO5145684.1 alpha-L-arabinofuranosidase [Lachnospiraceae bacterium]
MKLLIGNKRKHPIQDGMIGLFFEDINYAADGGLYAEMIENRSFEFVEAFGDKSDYYVKEDGGYGWSAYPSEEAVSHGVYMGSPLCEENPHYMRVTVQQAMAGIANKAYDGIYLQEGEEYLLTFWVRPVKYTGDFVVRIAKENHVFAECRVKGESFEEETYNYYRKYTARMTAQESCRGAQFLMLLAEPGTAEFDYISMFPANAAAGIFRADLFALLEKLHPGFIRFPGGCIVEGNTLQNRYRYKDSLKEPWKRKNNWNRWAVHDNCAENAFHSRYAHYNQTMGLGFYEYFLLCELLGAKALPVLNVGFACQYQSTEQVSIDSDRFQELIQDALDLIEFANGGVDTRWGAVRAGLGHEKPFGLSMLGIGNEQWQTQRADFFERYAAFEKAIHAAAPQIQLIGSAGPDITSEKYEMAWKFYRENEDKENFVYAVDEHYYVKPQWLYDHVDFYDNYPRKTKVFSGEYAAHPFNGFNRPDANTLEGALAEAAFLTGVERNADVVVLASYAPLFARLGYTQWSPDMIWFDAERAYGTPSYHVQCMYSNNMGDTTLDTDGKEKEAAKQGIYYSLSFDTAADQIIVKAVNAGKEPAELDLELAEEWQSKKDYTMQLLTGDEPQAHNAVEAPDRISVTNSSGRLADKIKLPANAFAVIRI